jgi:signal transduction histidine kinase
MRISLVSRDRHLYDLCSELLREILDDTCSVNLMPTVAAEQTSSDLYIGDLTPGETDLPKQFEPDGMTKHFFVLDRKHLGDFETLIGPFQANVLLKPVTRATMRAFLDEACSQWKRQHSDPAFRMDVLRAERDDMLQCLIQANLKLQEYDQERTNFLARAVHDFRAPLTALNGYCGLLLGEQLGPMTPDQRDVLERMHHSARRLARMADAMFQLSVSQRIEQRLNLEKADVRDCIDQALHEITPLAEEKRISVSVDVIPPTEPMLFESAQMEQVLINLLDNACKFTPRNGRVEINAYPFFWERRTRCLADSGRPVDRRMVETRLPNAFRVDIRDSGPGILRSHLDKIFEEYTSYSGGQDRSGGGLGLAICRLILKRHEGRVWAESTSSGAMFSFTLPFHRNERHAIDGNHSIQTKVHVGAI